MKNNRYTPIWNFLSTLGMLSIVFLPVLHQLASTAFLGDELKKLDLLAISRAKRLIHENELETAKLEGFSNMLIGSTYNDKTLVGGPDTKEELVLNLLEVDCFTYIDYIEAFRRSDSLADFREHLISVRYFDNDVSYSSRKHFFADWKEDYRIEDVTLLLSKNAKTTVKILNVNADGELYLDSIPPKEAEVSYIPTEYVDDSLISKLQTGDYIGIYTDLEGLDVTHVGMFTFNKEGEATLRHASSLKEVYRVDDQLLTDHIKDKTGIIVFRGI